MLKMYLPNITFSGSILAKEIDPSSILGGLSTGLIFLEPIKEMFKKKESHIKFPLVSDNFIIRNQISILIIFIFTCILFVYKSAFKSNSTFSTYLDRFFPNEKKLNNMELFKALLFLSIGSTALVVARKFETEQKIKLFVNFQHQVQA